MATKRKSFILRYKKDNNSIEINLCKSAPAQSSPIPIINELTKYWKNKGYKEIIDVGCGKLRNSLFLVKHFLLWICDFPEQFDNKITKEKLAIIKNNRNFMGIVDPTDFKKGQLKADAALLSFVIHTLPEKRLRIELIRNTMKNLKPPYEIFIAAPYGENYYKSKMKDENRFNDGFLIRTNKSQKTFYRDYTPSQLDELMRELGFEVEKIFNIHKRSMRIYSI